MGRKSILTKVRERFPDTPFPAEDILMRLYDQHRGYGNGGIYAVARIIDASPSGVARTIEKIKNKRNGHGS